MKRIFVIEELCNGCRLCQTFCSSLEAGVFSEAARLRVVKVAGEERDIPQVEWEYACGRTNLWFHVLKFARWALFYADSASAEQRRRGDSGRREFIQGDRPWKWPFRGWGKGSSRMTGDEGENRNRPAAGEFIGRHHKRCRSRTQNTSGRGNQRLAALR
jgi:hypothetical protein